MYHVRLHNNLIEHFCSLKLSEEFFSSLIEIFPIFTQFSFFLERCILGGFQDVYDVFEKQTFVEDNKDLMKFSVEIKNE